MYLRLASRWPQTCYATEDDPEFLMSMSGTFECGGARPSLCDAGDGTWAFCASASTL